MATLKYDLVVIGAGPGGSEAASTAAAQGVRVALVERHKLGGTCLNYGCDPTKTLLHSAKILWRSHQAEKYGLLVPVAEFDWSTVLAHVQKVIETMRGGTEAEGEAELKRQGVDVVYGEAVFVSPHEIMVGNQLIRAEQFIIAVGGEASVPPVKGLKEAGYITNIEAVSLPRLPGNLAIIGGGAIGIEFAQLFHRFGVEVTVLEHGSNILDTEDREVADKLQQILTDEGICIETEVEIREVTRDDKCKRLLVRCGERDEEEVVVDEILLATGRRPSLTALRPEMAGIKTTDKGIEVDATLQTNVTHIWAVGDITTPYQFTHVANEQGKLVAHNAFASQPAKFDDKVIPWVTFTDPELAHVGKTEEELRKANVKYRAATVSFDKNERALTTGATEGMVKLLVGSDGKLLGGHILGAGAGELLTPLVLMMHANLPIAQLANTIMPYPTMSEALRQAAMQASDKN